MISRYSVAQPPDGGGVGGPEGGRLQPRHHPPGAQGRRSNPGDLSAGDGRL